METLTLEPPVAVSPRAQRTRAALRDALAGEIVATGDLGQVTVTAVSDRAGVTRRTFYSHYRDIPDLVCQIEDETVEGLRPLVLRLANTHLDELERTIRSFGACPGGVDLLAYCEERRSYLAPLLGDGGDPAFAERLKRLVREVVEPRALEGFCPGTYAGLFDYYLTFVISAEVGVLVRWLTTGTRESVDAMARIMTALAFVRPGDLYGRPITFDIPNDFDLIVQVLASVARTEGDQR